MKAAIVFALLILATVGLNMLPPEWQAEPIDTLVKPEPDGAPASWHLSPNAVVDRGAAGATLRLGARGMDTFASAQYIFTPAPGLDYVFVEVQSSAKGVAGDISHWPHVGVLLHALDKDGKRLGYWPFRAAGRNGDHERTSLRGLWPIPKEAVRIRVIAYLLADAGEAELRGLELKGGKTRTGYTVLYWMLILAWLAFGLSSAHRAMTTTRRRPLGVATITLTAAVIAAGVAPQPYMYESVRSVAFMAQDVMDSTIYQWRVLTSPDDGRGEAPESGADAPASDTQTAAATPDDISAGSDTEVDGDVTEEAAPDSQLTPPEVKSAHKGKPLRQHYWEPGFPSADKAAHFSAFLVLAVCIAVAWPGIRLPVCIVSAAGISVSIQILQTLTVTREFDWWDFGADLTGVLFGALAVRILSTLLPGMRLRGAT